ncbi:MAG TPA: O-antigen ligase family protein, partial [Lacipirellulaceae bacterium]|nr:O-antigen ligase family protein [Lacipirellulaceae bacterium]
LFGPSFLSAHGAVLTALVLCAVSVLTSLSRNGAIAMVAAAAVVGAALYVRGTLSRQGWIVAMLPLAALAAALVFGFDAVYRRLATLSDTDQLASRWEMAEGALRAWREFPLWGAGLGTHEYVFPMFDRSVSPQLAAHADNDYVQLLEEAGLLGAACLAAFFAIIAVLAVRTGCRGRTSLSAGALGPAFGLVAVAIHSATDFGQRLPAVFCLTAVSCALIVRLDRIERRAAAETLRRPLPFALRRAHAAVGLVAVGAALWWALGQTYAAYLGEQWWAAAYEIENEIRTARQDAQDQQYADLLAATEQAATLQPRNVAYAYALNLYRWPALVASLAANAEPPGAAAAFQDVVQRLADELSAVRRLAPTYGPPYGLEGQLRWLVLEQPRGQRLIDLGTKLAPYDPATCLIAAEMKSREDHAADAERLLRRAVALDAGLFPDAAGMALDILSDPQLATELADGRYERLQWLADQATRR